MGKFIKIPEKCLKALGYSFEVQKLTCGQVMRHVFIIIFIASAQVPLYYTIYYEPDLVGATYSLSVVFTNTITLVKMGTFLANKFQFLDLIKELGDLFNERDKLAGIGLEKTNKIANRFVSIYLYSTVTTAVYFTLSPLIAVWWNQWRYNRTVSIEMPMKLRFPFPTNGAPEFELAYIYTVIVFVLVVAHAVAIDGLFIIFALNIKEHFRIIQHRLTTSSHDSHIKYCVGYHNKILDLSEKCRQMYNPIIFGQFFLTSLQVCVIVYQLMKSAQNMMSVFTFLSFFMSILLQLLIYCFGGEMITNESVNIGEAIQLCDWYKFSPSTRRSLSFMLQRSQKPVQIKSGFYEACLRSFVNILKGAMSYVTLMQSIEK